NFSINLKLFIYRQINNLRILYQSGRQPTCWSIHPTSWLPCASKNSHLSTLNNGEVSISVS
ncbi:hypothetical protein PanWU01x14_284920, partial [Parasponia andersonii]